jgi:hypothetical protein
MALMDILAAAQGGAFLANVGRAAGLDETTSRAAIGALGPAIAEKLRRRAEDAEALDALLDLLEDGDGDAFLDDPELIDDAEVTSDGKAVLKDIYGSLAAALDAGAGLTGLSMVQVQKLMPIAAASVLAALARANGRAQPLAGDSGGGSGGLLGSIVSAVIEGAVKGAAQSLAPKRRRRRYAGYSTYRRKKRTTRRTRRPSLESIFREILTGR